MRLKHAVNRHPAIHQDDENSTGGGAGGPQQAAITVLVIDDEASLLRMLQTSLTIQGFRVETALDGMDGLDALARVSPHVIILDLEMPRMDGRIFFAELRSLGHMTPVIVLSAFGAEAARRELGADAALEKPFDAMVLGQLIRRLVAGDEG